MFPSHDPIDTDTDWSKVSGVAISGGKANFTNVASNSNGIYQSSVLQANKNYKVEFTISNYSSGNITAWSGGSQFVSDNDTFNSNGTKVIEFNSGFTNGYLLISTYNEIGNFSIDNVSVKEQIDADFDFTRGSSATRVNEQGLVEDVQILSGELVQNGNFEQIGSELVTNGGFDTDSDWGGVGSNGFSISGGKLNLSDIAYAKNVTQGNVTTVGKIYKVTFEISNYVKGNVRVFLGGNVTTTRIVTGKHF